MSVLTDSGPLAAPAGDRCANCEAPLASDQRYCVNCGLRRGRSRFSLESMAAQAAPPPAPPTPPRRPVRRAPSGVTLVTGVATLLLAMGVGVLIGHDSSTPAPQRASAGVQVVTVGGSGGAAAAGATAAKARGKSNRTTSHTAAKTAKQLGITPTVVHLNKKTTQAAAQAATKVFGQHSRLAPPTTQVGQPCAQGAGCQGGKFTGNFFH
jgi:hypothetical protein